MTEGVYDVEIFIPIDSIWSEISITELVEDLLGYPAWDVSVFRSPDVIRPWATFRARGEEQTYSMDKFGDWKTTDSEKPSNYRPYER